MTARVGQRASWFLGCSLTLEFTLRARPEGVRDDIVRVFAHACRSHCCHPERSAASARCEGTAEKVCLPQTLSSAQKKFHKKLVYLPIFKLL